MVVKSSIAQLSSPIVGSTRGLRTKGWQILSGQVYTRMEGYSGHRAESNITVVTGGLLNVIPSILYFESIRIDAAAVVWDDALPGWLLPMVYGRVALTDVSQADIGLEAAAFATRARGFENAHQPNIWRLRPTRSGIGVALTNLDQLLYTRRRFRVGVLSGLNFVTYGEQVQLGFDIVRHIQAGSLDSPDDAAFRWTSMNGARLEPARLPDGRIRMHLGFPYYPLPEPPDPPETGVAGIPVRLAAEYENGVEVRPKGRIRFGLSTLSEQAVTPEQALPCAALGQTDDFSIDPFTRDGTGWRFPLTNAIAGHSRYIPADELNGFWRTYEDYRVKHAFAGAELLDLEFYLDEIE